MGTDGSRFLNCPRCGLSIRPRAPWLAIEHCPRCMARAQIPVTLFASPLPPAELYPEGSVPSVERRGATTSQRGSR
ncbi:MAG: hypothetical protein WCD11_30145 [Solirubrobacteraceae bacterium]